MRVAHVAVVTPRRCGLYETTRELVTALREQGIDSRLCDPNFEKNKLHPKKKGENEDRGAPFDTIDWAKTADILVNHSGLGSVLEATSLPIIHVAHGRPRSGFLIERKGGAPVYSYHYHKSKDKRFRAVVTFWPEHVPYLEVMWHPKPVRAVAAPVDLDFWTPKGPNGYKFHGMSGQKNFVVTDAWRDDIDPYSVVNAFALYSRKNKGAKLHIYGAQKDMRGWAPLLKKIQDQGNLGEVQKWVTGLDHVYRAADMLLTPHRIAVRSMRESMATGCPVFSMGALDPATYANSIDHEIMQPRDRVREKAEQRFDPKITATQFKGILDGCW